MVNAKGIGSPLVPQYTLFSQEIPMFSLDLLARASEVVAAYDKATRRISVAESCTGGLVCAALTSVPGASRVLDRGFITYSNEAKRESLGVDRLALEQFGAVSPQVAAQMAQGTLAFSQAETALSVTGIAGPEGGSVQKPVGLVCFALATREGVALNYTCHFSGDRAQIRLAAVAEGLKLLLSVCS